ncbi:MAG: TGS domain-containing protein, partial [Anaerolineales bacterium]|nr:TGS domain-containing protein [Anaerolineales bacterium]
MRLYYQQVEQQKPLPIHLSQPLLIVTETKADCYAALGIIHDIWPPEQEQMVDYIAAPKPNGYRALHTQVRYDDGGQYSGQSLLVLIQDEDMYLIGEYGLTAVWMGLPPDLMPSFGEAVDAPPGMISLFTPARDRHDLPEGATPVDFAYTVHSSLGHQCTGAVVNGRMVSLNHHLEHGDVVKILTSTASVGPSREWLEQVQTRKARHRIRLWFRNKDSENQNMNLPADAVTIFSLTEAGLPQRLAGCCRPQPPDPIVGYVNRRNNVVVHAQECHNVQSLKPLVKVEWNTIRAAHNIEVEITAVDRAGLVRDISQEIANDNVNMISFHADSMPDGSARIRLGLSGSLREGLQALLTHLRQVRSVRNVTTQRLTKPQQLTSNSILDHHFINPYTLNPVSGKGFYGRWEELRTMVENLRGVRPGEAVLLWGPRRIGKTSLLLQFQQNVMSSDDYLLAFVDMQPLSGRSTTAFLLDIMHAIRKELPDKGMRPPPPNRLRRDPLGHFRHYIERNPALLERHLVLILDEFQLLAGLTEDGVSLADINRYFRSLIQHRNGLSIIFSGGGVLDRLLQQPEASFMLEVVRHQKIECLDTISARRLITEPVERIQYDPDVVTRLLDLTARHPYYLQWICGELVSRADQEQRPFVTTLHLQQLLEEWVPQQGEQFFSHLWGSSIGFDRQTLLQHKLILTAVSNLAPADRWVSFDAIAASGVLEAMGEG